MESSAIDEAESTEVKVPQINFQTEMNNNIGNTSSNSPPNLTLLRERSNSAVIDSIGLKRYLAVFASSTARRRSKSLTATDYYTLSVSHCTDNLCIPGTSRDDQAIRTTNNRQEGEQFNKRAISPLSTIDAIGTIEKKPLLNSPPKLTALMPVEKDADCYNMNHKNRGKCIIFNHEDFSMSTQLKRVGTAKDAERLQKTFGNLGFDVELHNDFTFSEIQDVLKRVSQLDHTDNDCLCVITLTHGLQRDIICANDVMYESNELWKPFAADKCLTLAGKPKLFFIQACRGDESDDGVQLVSNRSLRGTETDSVTTSYSIPIHADFLLAHSSIEGFYTWRSPFEGTWYIQCLCDILDEHGTTMDLMKMLTLTARKVATEFSSVNLEHRILHNKRQVPSVTTMLIRSVHFPPKSKK
ncbi:PREDICTED: caspase-1-like isoform X1 [Atta colombica]|uniref:caspase-1-like isoform X1 n=1 Tax=Atta colombica TaxID=520822 RepID=UPI00084C2EB2|nr:PREDICTED: caspase-1-like isoform X1 [Atta colombica]